MTWIKTADIFKKVFDFLEGVSDEVGEKEFGKYVLIYEGWGGVCVEESWDETKSDEENEDLACEYAEGQTDSILEEWKLKYEDQGEFVDGGYQAGGLYGVTWALFKKK